MISHALSCMLIAYLLGSIPSAYLVTKLILGKDIRQLGDGNMGAKNVFHSVGWLPGVMVAIMDITKGGLAIIIARTFHLPQGMILAAGLCATIGHDYPLFAHFHGGQGMATIVGTFCMLFPFETLFAACVFGLVLALSHNWDFSCVVAFVVLMITLWILGFPPKQILYPFLVLPTIALRRYLQQHSATRHATV
jgi:glycerol-3-phosphate acyltransferase PlsY